MNSVGPESTWEKGSGWMSGEFSKAIAADILKPASELRINPEEEKEFNDGCIFEKPEILVRGHVLTEGRISKIEERAIFSDYLVIPTKLSFPAVVRLFANVMKFARRCSKNRKILIHLMSEANLQFSVFCTFLTNAGRAAVDEAGNPGTAESDSPSDEELSMALTHLYQKASREVKKFNSSSLLKKHTAQWRKMESCSLKEG